jgi:hypothetical protein
MNYYESVVIDYLRSDRALFVNTECCVQINTGDNPDVSGPHWYCDAAACDFRTQTVFLCEISYSKQLSDLTKRLIAWHEYWPDVRSALARDSCLPVHWPVRPWIFVPETLVPLLLKRFEQIGGKSGTLQYLPRITTLEMVQPWKYRSWNRCGESEKPEMIPPAMRM